MATVVVGVCEVVWCFLLFVNFLLSSVFCEKKAKKSKKKKALHINIKYFALKSSFFVFFHFKVILKQNILLTVLRDGIAQGHTSAEFPF